MTIFMHRIYAEQNFKSDCGLETEETEKIRSYFQHIRYQLVGYDVMLDKFCAGAGTPYLYRNFFAVPDEIYLRSHGRGQVGASSESS